MVSKKMCEKILDGALKDYKDYMAGEYKGFYITIDYRKPVYIVYIHATPTNDAGKAMMESFLEKHRSDMRYLSKFESKEHTVKLRIVEPKPKKTLPQVFNDTIHPVIIELLNCKYKPGCINCGSNEGNIECYDIYGYHHYICDECIPKVKGELDQKQQEKLDMKGNTVPGTIGAVLGGLIGCGLWVGMYNSEAFAAFPWIAGFAIVFLVFWFYGKLGGHLDKKGYFICIGIIAVMPFIANHFAWLWAAYVVKQIRGYSLPEYLLFYKVLKDYNSGAGYLIELAVGYVFTGIINITQFRNTYKKCVGSYRFKKLTDNKANAE